MTTSAPHGTVRVAISGCGAVTELYYAPTLRALARTRRIEVVALSDPDRGRLDTLSAVFPRAARCSELASAFVTKPQLLIIASPPRFHVKQVLAALSAGIDVLCEKPLAGSCTDARRLAEAEATSGRLLAIGMVRRHMPAARMIRTVLTRGVLGAITGFEVFEGGPFRWPVQGGGYFDARTSGGGVLLDIGAHVLDLLTWWLGPPANVVAADDAMGGIEANSRLTLDLGGVPGVVRLSRDWERPNHVTIRGAKGVLRWNLADTDRVTVTLDGEEPLELRAPAGAPATFLDCFRAQFDAVLDARDGTPTEVVRAAELLPSIGVIEAAYRDRTLMAMPWLSAHERAVALRTVARSEIVTTRTIAVVGANGFIGSRLVEMLHLDSATAVRPVVRRASALASAARFALEGRVADALDMSALRDALAGCDAVVHCVAGDAKTIVKSAEAVYAAAEAAGCRRLVYLSSACVHGQSPAPGTDERSILSDRQPIDYNNAKVRAERSLRALRERGHVELVVLRPAIVFGPRSQWIAGFADDVLAGRAYFAGDDSGVCNSLYVDNLVHAIRLAVESPRADREAYLLGDEDAPAWRELYRPFARALGARVEDLPVVPYHAPSRSVAQTIDRLRSSRPVQGALMRLPERLRRGLGAFYAEVSGIAEKPDAAGAPALPTPSLEMTLLHGCRYRLPWRKAHEELGYSPVVTLDEALRRTVGWLAFAGYPVTGAALAAVDHGGSVDAG